MAALAEDPAVSRVVAASRTPPPTSGKVEGIAASPADEASLAALAAHVGEAHLILVATGALKDDVMTPEKSWKQLEASALAHAFAVNSIGPALAAKHLLPCLAAGRKTAFAALSARVGSIADNNLGGWHGYRASKAALNQLIRCLAIELARTRPQALCVALHPGTVDTGLSKPFQRGVAPEKLFTPDFAAQAMLGVLDALDPASSGGLFAWDGTRIRW